jgi:hypothetical protein
VKVTATGVNEPPAWLQEIPDSGSTMQKASAVAVPLQSVTTTSSTPGEVDP